MGLLDDLKAVGVNLPPEVKVIAADVQDVVSGLIHALETSGVVSAQVAQTVQEVSTAVSSDQPTGDTQAQPQPETVGNLVADITPGPPPAPEADPLTTLTVEQLTEELAKRQQQAIQTADAQKSQVVVPG